jgi:hypothetical protein
MAFSAGDSCAPGGIVVSVAGVGTFVGTALQSDPIYGIIMPVVSNVLFNDGTVAVGAAPSCRKVGVPDKQVLDAFLGRFVQFQAGSASSASSGAVIDMFKLEVLTIGGQDPDTNIAVVRSDSGSLFLFDTVDLTVVNR